MTLDPKLLWENLSPSDLDKAVADTPIAYVPCGSLEWHGEHLPLGCDLLRAAAICHRAAARSGGVVLPTLYTTAPGFSAYRGSIFFSCRLVKALVAEMLRELDKVGVRVAVMLIAHAGRAQQESFAGPAGEYEAGHEMRVLVSTGWELLPADLRAPGGHAGTGETQECMAARPESVDLKRYDPANTALPRYEGLDPATYHDGLPEESQEHVRQHMAATEWQWDPDLADRATREAGERQLDAVAKALAERASGLLG
ncbi:creatininase family protein [Verrucomicrobiota bacterium]